jgi:hypothetical protein
VAETSPHFARDLAKLAPAIRQLAEQPLANGPLLPLETRRLRGGPAAPERAAEEAWSRYARGSKEQLSEPDLQVLRQDLAQAAADPALALAGGRLVRYRLQEVLDDLGIAREKAAGLLLDDLRQDLTVDSIKRLESIKRLAWRGSTLQGAVGARSRTAVLTKTVLDSVSMVMGGEITAFAKRPAEMESLAPLPEQEVMGSLHKLHRTAVATAAADPDVGEREAKEVVRLLERLAELARRYTVDLVGVVEHYLETAQRILREAQQVQARRQLASDQRAIARTLAELDPGEVARGVAALPLYLHRYGAGEDTLGTALLPRLADERLTRSYARLCLRLLQLPDGAAPEAKSADRPPPAAPAANA